MVDSLNLVPRGQAGRWVLVRFTGEGRPILIQCAGPPPERPCGLRHAHGGGFAEARVQPSSRRQQRLHLARWNGGGQAAGFIGGVARFAFEHWTPSSTGLASWFVSWGYRMLGEKPLPNALAGDVELP